MADMPMPDLSNLTEEERRQIEEVINRQKHEEAKDKEVVQNLANEVKQIEQRVIQQKTQQPFSGLLPDPNKEGLCDICQKVKFSDGIGHQCNYCRLHCCVRCGGRVPIKNGKFTWVCSLCKKKQDLLKKTGQWYHGNPMDLLGGDSAVSPNASMVGAPGMMSNHHAGMGNNVPQNGGNNRQQQQQQQHHPPSLQRQKSHDPGGGGPHQQQRPGGMSHSHSQLPPQSLHGSSSTQMQRQQSLRRHQTVDQGGVMSRSDEERLLSQGRGTGGRGQQQGGSQGLARQGSVIEGGGSSRRDRDASRTRQPQSGRGMAETGGPSRRTQPGGSADPFDILHAPTAARRPDSQGGNTRERRYDESGHLVANHSDYSGSRAPDYTGSRGPLRRAQSHDRYGSQDYADDYDPRRGASYDAWPRTSGDVAVGGRGAGGGGGGPGAYGGPSRASSALPPPLLPSQQQQTPRRYPSVEDRRRTYQQSSFSSEEDLQSNISEFTMADDGSIRSYSSEQSTRTHPDLRHMNSGGGGAGGRPGNRRMWRQSSQQEQGYYSQEGYSISGDTRPSEVSWRPTDDGRRMIGHIILRKDNFNEMNMGRQMNCAAALGLRIEGGKMTHSGRLAAFIVRVKRGSVAELMGHLRAGDEVLEWNAVPLRGLTFQEVYDIIEDSRNDSLVELMVSRRSAADYRLQLQQQPGHYFRSQLQQEDRRFSPQPSLSLNHPDGGNIASGGAAAGLLPTANKAPVPYVSGRIQLSFYYSHTDAQLAVTVIQAAALLPRPDGSARNAYAKLYLLPNRSEQTKRRTKIISKTNDPQWQQIFYYAPLKESELEDLTLEIMVWDYERYKQTSNEFVGEVLIGLGSDWRNDCPAWYYLTYPDTGLENRRAPPRRGGYEDPDFNTFSSMDGISPANSSASRLSDIPMDSYISDADMLEAVDRRKQRGAMASHQLSRYGGNGSPRHQGGGGYGFASPVDSPRQMMDPRDHRRGGGRESPHGLHYDTNRMHDRGRGRREAYGDSPQDDVRHTSRRHTSAPPVGDDYYYTDEQGGYEQGSPPGSRTSSARKRQLPIRPNDNALHGGTSPSHSHQLSPRRTSLSTSNKNSSSSQQLLASDDQLLLNLPSHVPSSPASNASRHSQSKAPIMQQLHNQTLKVPGSEDDTTPIMVPPSISVHGSSIRHAPALNQLLNNTSQEENIDPQTMMMMQEAAETRHSRSSSRRSVMRKPSASLSRSSEPTESDLMLLVTNSDGRSRKLSESLPRLQSLNIDDGASQLSALAVQKSVSNTDVYSKPKFDFDDYANKFLEQQSTAKDRKTKSSAKAAAILGLQKKDSKKPTFSRSEEVGHQSPASVQRALLHKQMSKDSTDGSVSSSGYGGNKAHRMDHTHLASFVDGLGPGQVVGRQVLALPCLGEIQLHIKYTKGNLEVEVVRAKGLVNKSGTRQLPACYVKVYIMEDKRIVAKQKTVVSRRSLDPLWQQTLGFEDHQYIDRASLQVSVWGEVGRMEKKLFMGVALINLDELDLSTIIIGWYKLFDSATVLAPATKSSLYAASVSGVGSNNSSMDEKSSPHGVNPRSSAVKT
ncbi:Regulating synaptic membrane exocytosis protein 2 [Hypsibius exemplaris]|uniref:Regulating synaptic membrane exocytosis protein 2 n=1 Tax=Hypsibius exemplaris TaxID=2072580 RepID=A0A1W0X7D4_HYPEX|nr:Regulating synaptic membrane exocytosis protein 2 [Hypsibius exemplaris]